MTTIDQNVILRWTTTYHEKLPNSLELKNLIIDALDDASSKYIGLFNTFEV